MEGIGRDRLQLQDVPIPAHGKGEILVKVTAVALNYRNKMVIESGRGLLLIFPSNGQHPIALIIVKNRLNNRILFLSASSG